MSRPDINPHLKLPDYLVENTMLTPTQMFALPILKWFFNINNFRGQGRTVVCAHLCLQLAMEGNVVYPNDIHTALLSKNNQYKNSYFINALYDIMKRDYPKHIFELKETPEFKLIYLGKKSN